jgi:hypothetical protein
MSFINVGLLNKKRNAIERIFIGKEFNTKLSFKYVEGQTNSDTLKQMGGQDEN